MRIITIEDDLALSSAIKKGLQKEGYAVDAFNDPKKGVRHVKLNHSDYDLIILDLMMPGMTGFEICREFRDHGIFTPIMILTGLTELHNKVNALDLGADDYVTKPFSSAELFARVRALLRRPKASLPVTLEAGPINLNQSTRAVTCKNKKIFLTLKEFALLEYLIVNSNNVISRDKILDHVWDSSFSSFSNIVDVHITHLRKKLEKAGAKDALETIRGVGYRIKSS